MSENRKCISTLDMEKVSAILLDVAGTTTAISFVKETLYPYVIKNVEELLKNSWENDDVKKAVEQFEEKDLDATKAAEVVKNLTEKDDSNLGLKTIQGLLSKKGYESGDLKGHVFDDLPKFFEAWSSTKKFAVFSSGSVQSQQLLFENSTAGNLTSHIKKFFDLSIGSKTDSETYKTIAKELEVAPADILYLTDDIKEAEAAKSADLNVVLIEREGNAPISEDAKAHFAVVKSFADISVENMKRKIVEVEGSNEEPPTKMAKIEENEGIIESAKDNVPNEKTDVEVGVEAMEVDQEPIATEKVEGEKAAAEDQVIEPKEAAPEENKVPEKSIPTSEETKAEEQPAAMEVDSKENDSNADINNKEQTIKSETEIGTQTKPAVTNECETQTTISLAAADELPIKKVEGILMSSEEAAEEKVEKKEEHTNTKEADSKVVEIEKKEVEKTGTEVTENKIEEQKENDTEKSKEVLPETTVEKTDTEGKEDKIEEQKENDTEKSNEVLPEIKSDSMATEENKENIKAAEECNKEVKEVNKDNGEAVNGDSCEKVDESKPAQNGVAEDKETPKEGEEIPKEDEETSKKVEETSKESEPTTKEGEETSEDKKENGAQEESAPAEANGVKDETVGEQNKDTVANGKGSEVTNGEAIESTNGTKELNEEEIKVKKIGNNVESAAVSVEA